MKLKLKCNTCDGIFDTVDVRFTKKCDNKCSFCIEQFSSVVGKETDVDSIFNSILSTGTDEVLILGGEPFIEIDKLRELVLKLKNSNITIYITTSLPKLIINKHDVFTEIMDNIDGLNVSVHSIDNKENNAVYRNNSHNRLDLLKQIVSEHSDKVRVCVNLIKNSINSFSKVHGTMMFLHRIGVKKVKINELCHSNEFVSFEDIMGKKMGSPYATGCYTRVLRKEYPGMQIELKRACFLTESTLSASLIDLIKVILNKYFIKPLQNKFCVVYEDGTINRNWL